MSGTIRMTPEQMRSRAGEYRTQADAVHDVISKMDSLLSALQSEWEGASAQSYEARYQELKPNFIKVEELIQDIATALDNAANTLEQADQGIKF